MQLQGGVNFDPPTNATPLHVQPSCDSVPRVGDWVKRRYVPEDERGIVYLWLKSAAHARSSRQQGAQRDASGDERVFWSETRPIVEMLLRDAVTEVICDPERSTYENGKQAVIWAFACASGDVVHNVLVKRDVVREVGAGFAGELVKDLLGERLNRACRYTQAVRELRNGKWGVQIPVDVDGRPLWVADTTWLARHIFAHADVQWLAQAIQRARTEPEWEAA